MLINQNITFNSPRETKILPNSPQKSSGKRTWKNTLIILVHKIPVRKQNQFILIFICMSNKM